MSLVPRAWLARALASLGALAAIYALYCIADWASIDKRIEAADLVDRARLILDRSTVTVSTMVAGVLAIVCGIGLGMCLAIGARETRARERDLADRLARAEADMSRLREAIESLGESFVLFDADDRLVLSNQRFRDMFRASGVAIGEGVPYADILHAAARRGLFPDAIGRLDDWIAEKLSERGRFTPHELQLSDDRWIMISDRPTRSGGFVGVRSDITELKRRETELRAARRELERQSDRMRVLAEEARVARNALQDAIESINEGFSLFDAEDRLVMCNTRWLELHGHIRDRIRPGVTFAEILRAAISSGNLVAREDIDAEVAERVAARRAADTTTMEERFDEDRWFSVSTRRMTGGGVVSVLNDITDMKQREFALGSTRSRLEKQAREMSLLADAAQRANRAKSEFLAMMSHEIRTPLNGVISALNLVADTRLPSTAASLIETARGSANALLSILKDVLDMSKIEAGKLELAPRPFALRELVEGVAALCRVQAEGKGLMFRARLAEDAPEWVTGDVDRLRQMTLNYVTNAVKFTETGGIDFEITRARSGGDMIRFEVTDTGIGIPLEKHGQVFRDFTQLDQSLRRRYGGTGLGLAITRRLARMMGGTVGFDSEPGVGSRFWFEAPLPAAAPASEEVSPSRESDEADTARLAASGLRVLLVEDNDTNRLLARLMLEKMGCKVDEAIDGARAVEMAADASYGVVLMDISMPVMDGIEAARLIRASGNDTPIIALTAHMGEEFARECLDVGIDGRLTKPIDPAALRRRLASLCGAATPARLVVATPSPDVFDPAQLEQMREGLDAEAFDQVINSCRKDTNAELRALLLAMAEPDSPEAIDRTRRAAHKLVTLAATVGAIELAALVRKIETGAATTTDKLSLPAAAETARLMLERFLNRPEDEAAAA